MLRSTASAEVILLDVSIQVEGIAHVDASGRCDPIVWSIESHKIPQAGGHQKPQIGSDMMLG